MPSIKKKDKVFVLSGRDKGKTGEVLKVIPASGKVLVSKVNMVTKHRRPTQSEPGGVHKVEAPMPASKVALVCPKCGAHKRPKRDKLQTGERVRVCRACGEVML